MIESGVCGHLGRRAGGHDLPAVLARARADIDQVIGGADQLQVVLDHQHRVAQVAQPAQDVDQALRVARVQPDGRLVQHVQHARQPRAEQRRQPQALGLAGREGGRGALERQVAHPHFEQPPDALAQVVQDGAGEQHLLRR